MKLNRNANYMSYEGAHTLADRIRQFWAKQGKAVAVTVTRLAFPTDVYAVRSDMKNGFPAA